MKPVKMPYPTLDFNLINLAALVEDDLWFDLYERLQKYHYRSLESKIAHRVERQVEKEILNETEISES